MNKAGRPAAHYACSRPGAGAGPEAGDDWAGGSADHKARCRISFSAAFSLEYRSGADIMRDVPGVFTAVMVTIRADFAVFH